MFISYDEPNADHNFQELKKIIHCAARIQGVKGFAAAHREAGLRANTDYVVTIDGDTISYPRLLKEPIDVTGINLDTTVLCWPATNAINGLAYANAGVKLWPKKVLSELDTHEFAEKGNVAAQIDYTGGKFTHKEMPTLRLHDNVVQELATTHIETSPLQAWRAGFREGVKLGLFKGQVPENPNRVWAGLLNRLAIWMSVGMDVENGIWAIYGSRLGCYLTHFENWDVTQINNLDILNQYFIENVAHLSEDEVYYKCIQLGVFLKTKFKITEEPMSADCSKFFKSFTPNPEKMQIPQLADFLREKGELGRDEEFIIQ